MKDLIDDNPIEDSDSSDADSDASGPKAKRKKSDDESELDDRLEDEDYELIEENLGVKVERVNFTNHNYSSMFSKQFHNFLETFQTS